MTKKLALVLLLSLLTLFFGAYLSQQQTWSRVKAAVATEIIWSTSHETGDLIDWYKDQSGAVYNTGDAKISVTEEVAHTGRYALKKEVWGIDQNLTATRIFRWAEHLREGYFSCWYMFPTLPQVDGWLNVFQFKKKDYSTDQVDPTWYNEIKNKPQGTVLTLTHWEQEWDIPPNINEAIPLQTNKWFHIEWYYKDGIDDGIIKVWQDGLLIWDLRNLNTRGIDPDIQWAPSLYGINVKPGHLVLYVDDCVISSSRTEPGVTPTPTLDFKFLLSNWGSDSPDLNGDGIVNGVDFGKMLQLLQ